MAIHSKRTIADPIDQYMRRDPLDVLEARGGYYERPVGVNIEPPAPVVAYAGKYDVGDGTEKRYVGDVYCDCSAAEGSPHIYAGWARRFRVQEFSRLPENLAIRPNRLIGAPYGGLFWTSALGREFGVEAGFAEKEGGKLIWGRHRPEEGERVAIVEDVCNNLSTAGELCPLITEAGAIPTHIFCIVNRSSATTYTYGSLVLPIVCVIRKEFGRYRQDDPHVAALVQAGHVSWEPKRDRAKLQEIMRRYGPRSS